jgi:tetratricopeptide (TPR) repeat protein
MSQATLPADGGTAASALPVAPAIRGVDDPTAALALYEREIRALGHVPAAARLYHEIGRLWEEANSPRNAAIAYQNAYRLDPRYLPNLRSARRLFAEVGNWAMVAQLCEAQAAVVEDPAALAQVLFEQGRVLEERLGRADEALAVFARALELAPDPFPILVHLAGHHADARSPEALIDVYRRLAAAIGDPAHAARLLGAAAAVAEDRAGRPDEAAALLREAFARDRTAPEVLARLERHAEREGRTGELAAVLDARAALEGPAAGPTYLRLARVEELAGRDAEAEAALLAGRRAAPEDALLLAELGRFYEARGRIAELAAVLEERRAATADDAERSELELRLAGLYEERLDRPEAAIERYRAVLARSPGHARALTALGKLLHRRGDFEGLLATFRAEAAVARDPRHRAAKLFQAGALLEERLDRPDEAIAAQAEALEASPGFLPAHDALARLYERHGRWAELVALLEADVPGPADRDGSIATLSRIAELCAERLGDPARALDACRRLLAIAPDHLPTVRYQGRLAERQGDHQGVVAALEREAALTGDQRTVVALLFRACELTEERLDDPDRALEGYRRVLALAPAYLPALRALGRLYGERGRWADLAAMYREEAEVAPDAASAAELVFRIGELAETKQGDLERAIGAYREVLTLAPAHLPAIEALARIYRRQQDWERLVDVLREAAAIRAEPARRADVLFEAAELALDRLARPELALELHAEVLRLRPDHGASLAAIERLEARSGDPADLLAAHERAVTAGPTRARVRGYLELARIYLDRMGDAGRAATCCEAALALAPDDLGVLARFERVRGVQGDRHHRAEVRVRLAAHLEPAAAAAVLREAAADREAATPELLPLAELRRAHELRPDDEGAAAALERALRRAGDAAGLAALLDRRTALARDPAVRVALLLELGELRERSLGDRPGARTAFAAAVELDPGHLPALRAANRVLAALGDGPALRAGLVAEARSAADPGHAVDVLLEAGRLAEEAGDADGAVETYRAALARDPLDARVGRRLEDLLAARNRPDEVAALHEARAAAARTPAEAAASLVAAARVLAEGVGDRERALALLDAALARVPSHPEALERRGDLAFALGRHREAAQAWGARVQLGGDARHLAELHHRLGLVFARHLADPARAVAHLQTALAVVPDHPSALTLLAETHLAARNHAAAADALRRLIGLERDPETLARHHLALSRVLEEGYGDLANATRAVQAAVELAPNDPGALDRLADLYERLGDLPKLASLLERRAAAAATADPATAVALHLRAAAFQAGALRDPAAAVVSYGRALALAPDDARAREGLAAIFEADPGSEHRAIDEHRALLAADPFRGSSYRALYRIWRKTERRDRAWVAASVLAALRVAEPDELTFLAAAGTRPADPSGTLDDAAFRELCHPDDRTPFGDVLALLGEALAKLFPADLGAHGVGRSDRLRADHAVRRGFDRLLAALGAAPEACEVYLSRRDPATLAVEVGEPAPVVIGENVATRHGQREQAFLLGRLAYRVRRRNAALLRLRPDDVAAAVGAAIRLVEPAFAGAGAPDPALERRLSRALSRKAARALVEPARLAAGSRGPFVPEAPIGGAARSADRAGLLLAGDPGAALGLLLADGTAGRPETAAAIAAAGRGRPDAAELLRFAVSEEHLRLRVRLGLALA